MKRKYFVRVRFEGFTINGVTRWRVRVPFLLFFWQFLRVMEGDEVAEVAEFATFEDAAVAYDIYRTDAMSDPPIIRKLLLGVD